MHPVLMKQLMDRHDYGRPVQAPSLLVKQLRCHQRMCTEID